MKYYIVHDRHKKIFRPATTNSEVAYDYCYAMNLVTPGIPYGVTTDDKIQYLLSDGWEMCDWVGLFRRANYLAEEKKANARATLALANSLKKTEESVKQGELPF